MLNRLVIAYRIDVILFMSKTSWNF